MTLFKVARLLISAHDVGSDLVREIPGPAMGGATNKDSGLTSLSRFLTERISIMSDNTAPVRVPITHLSPLIKSVPVVNLSRLVTNK